ncbi:MAG: hypothetical protein QF886_23060 [Planctomycetota bacterium]|nr:hypothetical protein [Planctomycetota bacterium]
MLTDLRLSRFKPLPVILSFDDFDEGVNGWSELCGNHNGDLDQIRQVFKDMRPPQISNCTFFDIGTPGAMHGNYALKLATRPKRFHQAVGIKRLTSRSNGLVQVETYFAYKAEQSLNPHEDWDGNFHPSESDFGSFTIWNDICLGSEPRDRYMCALRYQNTDTDGNLVQSWSYKTALHPTTKMMLEGIESEGNDVHVASSADWHLMDGGHQPLCFNEVPTKVNWHYLRWTFDLAEHLNVELQVNDKIMDVSGVPVLHYPDAYSSIPRLLNFCIDVRTHGDVRNFLFLDSVLISMSE